MTVDKPELTCATLIYRNFADYQNRFLHISRRAAKRFMGREWTKLQADNTERLHLYTTAVDQTVDEIRNLLKNDTTDMTVWTAVKKAFAVIIDTTKDRAIAETFFNSTTRRIFGTIGVNPRIEFIHEEHPSVLSQPSGSIYKSHAVPENPESVIRQILMDGEEIQLSTDAGEKALPRIVSRISAHLKAMGDDNRTVRIDMIRPTFYRGQGAYRIGRIVAGDRITPLAVALLHPVHGVAVDALLMDSDAVSILFSYTRSAFHVDTKDPCELVAFLQSIIPGKPQAEIYSSIGYFKHGKTILYRDLCRRTAECTDERFRISPGKKGMVMVVFDMAGYEMVVKLIRDRFENPKKVTRTKVMQQYDFVFHHYRVGRLIEANGFERLTFERCWFSEDLIQLLSTEAKETVRVEKDRVVLEHAYLERKVRPLDIYLEEESPENMDDAVVDFGNAIKDLAYANIFPGDMLLKNFGVTRHGRVVFYDYDEIVPLTACRFRKIPQPRSFMEEMADEPWYTIGENDVFPEQFSRFLGLSPRHKDLFLRRHADLLQPEFWIDIQKQIRAGHIRHVRPYRSRYRLDRPSP